MSLSIPELPPDLVVPLRTLATAASIFRGVLIEVADGRAVTDVFAERDETLQLADGVLDLWLSHLQLPGAQTEDDPGSEKVG